MMTTSLQERPHPFDVLASDYDDQFSHQRLGRWLRNAVRQYLASYFHPGDHVLELGCGTGEDALWLAQRGVRVTATDASPAMLAVAREKVAREGLSQLVSLHHLDLLEIDPETIPPEDMPFDGAFSNFGALNCLPDRRPLARQLGDWIHPGGHAVLVLMGPACPWEILWHLMHRQPRQAFRRWQSGAEAHLAADQSVRVWYPSPRKLRREMSPDFRYLEAAGIGFLLPTTASSSLVDRWPGFFARLAGWEETMRSWAPATWLADHYLMVFRRH